MTMYNPPGASGDETTYEYTDDKRLERVTQPDGSTIEVAFDPTTGRVDSVTTSEGAVITPSYDAIGRVTQLDGPDVGNAVAFGYTGALPTSVSWSGSTTGTVGFGYNGLAQVSSQTVTGAASVNYTYDLDDLLLTAGSVTLARSATSGRVDTLTLGDLVETLSYDSFGDVEGSATVHAGTTDVYEYSLVRDQLGRIVEDAQIVQGGTPVVWAYEYDDRSRLSQVTRDGLPYAAYEYDANGNRVEVTTTGGTTVATYDEQDRLLTRAAWTYKHGKNGEITSKTLGADTWLYEYDALGQLTQVTLPNATKIGYEYDASGRPIARYVNDVYQKGWLWHDQLDPVAEVDEAGIVTAQYVYGSRGHVPDYVIKDDVNYRIITDYRGSVRAVVGPDGTVEQAIEYGPWGEVLSDSESGFQSFAYAGGLWDADTGLVLFGARWYDAETGRWTRKDPIRFDGGQGNLYLYSHAAPLNYIDPSGRVPVMVALGPPGIAAAGVAWLVWRKWGRGERYEEVENYYESKGYTNIEVYRGGFLDMTARGRISGFTFGETVHYGSECDPWRATDDTYFEHPPGIPNALHELGHVIGYRRDPIEYSARGIFSRIEENFNKPGESSWFELEASLWVRGLADEVGG